MEELGADVEQYFASGEQWAIDLDYGICMSNDSTERILKKQHGFCQGASLLIMDGFFFVHYDKLADYQGWHQEQDWGLLSSCETGAIIYTDENGQKNFSSMQISAKFTLSKLQNINDVFQISMQVISSEPEHYVLPAYAGQQGIFKGRDVEIAKGVVLNEPVIIGNHVRIQANTHIGPYAIIGHHVIIDEYTEISKSIVLEKSYVGRHLTVTEKIISGDYIISPEDGALVRLTDDFLLSSISLSDPTTFWSNMAHRSMGLGLILLQCLPFVVFGLLCKLQDDWQTEKKIWFIDSLGTSQDVITLKNKPKTLWGRLFRRFSLEKFFFLGIVVTGRLRLIGNRLLPSNRKNRLRLADFQEYMPGAFAYADADAEFPAPDCVEAEITERFYAGHQDLRTDIKMLGRVLGRQLTEKRRNE